LSPVLIIVKNKLIPIVALEVRAAYCINLIVFYVGQGFNLNRSHCQDKKEKTGTIYNENETTGFMNFLTEK
jgi:hypothetical protein